MLLNDCKLCVSFLGLFCDPVPKVTPFYIHLLSLSNFCSIIGVLTPDLPALVRVHHSGLVFGQASEVCGQEISQVFPPTRLNSQIAVGFAAQLHWWACLDQFLSCLGITLSLFFFSSQLILLVHGASTTCQ